MTRGATYEAVAAMGVNFLGSSSRDAQLVAQVAYTTVYLTTRWITSSGDSGRSTSGTGSSSGYSSSGSKFGSSYSSSFLAIVALSSIRL